MASDSLDSQASNQVVLQSLEAVGKRVLSSHPTAGLVGISMAMPGPFDYAAGVSYIRNLTKYDNLYGVNLRHEMARRFPDVPPQAVRFINDAQAALLGEVHCGAAVGAARVIGLTLGTGVGSAFAVDGKIVTSGPGVPPEGYIYCLPWEGGTVEDAISTRALQRGYRALTGELCEVRDIAARTRTDAVALSLWKDLGKTLGLVLQPLANGFRPEIIVLGGAIAQSAEFFLPSAESVLQGTGASLRVSTLLDRAALFGAAVAWQRS
jgi:glucokinase